MKTTMILGILFLHLFIFQLCAAAHLGVIEGFTWTSADPVFGQYGKYTSNQRDSIIAILSAPLNSYFFVPHDSSLSPSSVWSSTEKTQWANTISVAKDKGIKVIMGLRPGYIDSVSASLTAITTKINNDFIPAGVTEYILAWDDTPGAGGSSQMQLQKELISSLITSLPSITLSGVVPAAYYPGADVQPSGGSWAQKLQILDGANTSVAFFVTGTGVNPSSLSPSDVPTLSSGRKFIMWDNWIATDSNTQVTMTFPMSRAKSLYTSGYGLNLAFPPQRIIHQLKALVATSSSQTLSVPTLASQWAQYLVDNSFIPRVNQSSAATCLASIINDGEEDVSEIVKSCPMLSFTFTNDGDSTTSMSATSSTTSTTSTTSSTTTTSTSTSASNPTTPTTTSATPDAISTTTDSGASVVHYSITVAILLALLQFC